MPINDTVGDLYVGLRRRMVEALNLIARSARARASWSTKIRNAIRVGEVKEKAGTVFGYIEVDRTIAPEARAYEYGSGLRAKRGEKDYIIIAPKNVPKLIFQGTNEWTGQTIVVPPMGGGVVHHPGVAPRPFLTPAVQENKERIKQLLGEEFVQYVSKAIRFSWSKTR
jgi:hypothetical protein